MDGVRSIGDFAATADFDEGNTSVLLYSEPQARRDPPLAAGKKGQWKRRVEVQKEMRRFHCYVVLNPPRVGRDAVRIAEEVIAHLASLPGNRMRVTPESEAIIPQDVERHAIGMRRGRPQDLPRECGPHRDGHRRVFTPKAAELVWTMPREGDAKG